MANDTLKEIEQIRNIDPANPSQSEHNIAQAYVGPALLNEEGLNDIREDYFREDRSLVDQVRDQNQRIIGLAATDLTQLLNPGKSIICGKDPKTLTDSMNLSPPQLMENTIVDRAENGREVRTWLNSFLDTDNPLYSTRLTAENVDNNAMQAVYDIALRGVWEEQCTQKGLQVPPVPDKTPIQRSKKEGASLTPLMSDSQLNVLYIENMNLDESTTNHYAAPAAPRRSASRPSRSTPAVPSSAPASINVNCTNAEAPCGNGLNTGTNTGNIASVVAPQLRNTAVVSVDSSAPQEESQLTSQATQREKTHGGPP